MNNYRQRYANFKITRWVLNLNSLANTQPSQTSWWVFTLNLQGRPQSSESYSQIIDKTHAKDLVIFSKRNVIIDGVFWTAEPTDDVKCERITCINPHKFWYHITISKSSPIRQSWAQSRCVKDVHVWRTVGSMSVHVYTCLPMLHHMIWWASQRFHISFSNLAVETPALRVIVSPLGFCIIFFVVSLQHYSTWSVIVTGAYKWRRKNLRSLHPCIENRHAQISQSPLVYRFDVLITQPRRNNGPCCEEQFMIHNVRWFGNTI